LDYIKLGLFTIKKKILSLIYELNLPAKMKIYPVQHIVMLELAYRSVELPLYEMKTYKGQEENKWNV